MASSTVIVPFTLNNTIINITVPTTTTTTPTTALPALLTNSTTATTVIILYDTNLIAWACITVVLMCLAWLANLLSLITALLSSRIYISFYIFVANLSFLYLIVCCPLYMVFVSTQLRQPSSRISQTACNFLGFFNDVLRAVVNESYALLAVDQLVLVRWPAQHARYMSQRRAKLLVAFAYALALFLELFAAIGHSAQYRHVRFACITDAYFNMAWAILWYILFIAVPFVVAVFSYAGVFYFYKHRRSFVSSSSSAQDGAISNGTAPHVVASSSSNNSVGYTALTRNRFRIAFAVFAQLVLYVATYIAGSIMFSVALDRQTVAWGFWLSWIMAIFHPIIWPAINAQIRQAYRESLVQFVQQSLAAGRRARQLPQTLPQVLRAFRTSTVLGPPETTTTTNVVGARRSTVTLGQTANETTLYNSRRIERRTSTSAPQTNGAAAALQTASDDDAAAAAAAIAAVARRSTIASVDAGIGNVTPAYNSNDSYYGKNPFEEEKSDQQQQQQTKQQKKSLSTTTTTARRVLAVRGERVTGIRSEVIP